MRFIASTLALATILVITLTTVAARPMAEDKKVEITQKGFMPEKLEIKAGDRVTWTNSSEKEHSVTSNEKAPGEAQDKPLFDSGPIKPGATFQYTFEKAGTYGYHCSIDKTCKGVVIVK